MRRDRWLGAQADRGGRPLLVRAREFSRDPISNPMLPYLLHLAVAYEQDDESGLPSNKEYERIAEFEFDVLDTLDRAGDFELAFVETGSGMVGYFCYVSDVSEATNRVCALAAEDLNMEISADDDPDWRHYGRRMTTLQKQ